MTVQERTIPRRHAALARRARIAVVTARFPNGPTESFFEPEIAELSRRHDVWVFPCVHDLCTLDVALNALQEFVRTPLRVLRLFAAIVRAPRSLHARIKNAAVFPKALALARQTRRLGVEHVHAYWLSAPATTAYVISQQNGIPWSATGHRYDLVDFNMTSGPRPNAGFLRYASFIRTISKTGAHVVRQVIPASGPRIEVVRLGVRVPTGQAPQRSRRDLRVLCAASLVRVKDHPTLFRAIARVLESGVRITCTLAGDGSERRSLELLARTQGLRDVVRFEGFVSHALLLHRLQKGEFDVVLLTSTDRGLWCCEGVPVSLMEAMAAGIPCIATSSGGVGELVVDDENGLLCPPGDDGAIGGALLRLARDADLRQRLGARARETILQTFDARMTVTRLESLLGVVGSPVEARL